MKNLNESCEEQIRSLKLEQAKGNRMLYFTSFALIALIIIGSGVMMLYQAPVNYNLGYTDGNIDGNEEGYAEGYENGTNDATDELTDLWTSLNIVISEEFEIVVENDTQGAYNDTTFDLRRLDFQGIFWSLEIMDILYAYIEANNDSSVTLTNATDVEEKLNITSIEAGTFDTTFAQSFSLLQYIENEDSIIGNEYLIQEYNKAFMFTINLFLYANDTLFDADAEGFETMSGTEEEFTNINEATGTFIIGGFVFDLTTMDELTMIRTMDNIIEINSITLNVGGGTYLLDCTLNGDAFEMISYSFGG